MIKVMLIDDHEIVREGLKMVLSLDRDIMVISEASNGKEALGKLSEHMPDVILTDIVMPEMDGIYTVKRVRSLYPHIKIIILTTFDDEDYIFEGLKNGADGYILKDAKPGEIIKGIHTVYNGNILLQPEVATKVIKEFKTQRKSQVITDAIPVNDDCKLTTRESEVAYLISLGKSNREIAKLLFITEGTVRNHITSILQKLMLQSRTQIAIYMKNLSGNGKCGESHEK